MNIKYVWFWPQRKFIPLLVVDDILNDANLNLCKARECSGVVQKIIVNKDTVTKFLKYTDLVFNFNDPRDVEVKFGGEPIVHPFMFTKSTPLDYFLCKTYTDIQVYSYKSVSWYEARLNPELHLPINWHECVFKKDCEKTWQNLVSSAVCWPIFLTFKKFFYIMYKPLHDKILH